MNAKLRPWPLLLVGLFVGCLSTSEPAPVHFFQPELEPFAERAIPGTRPLRFDRVQAPVYIHPGMVWRLAGGELAMDPVNLWVENPAELFEQRLRDHFFAAGGFRESFQAQDPRLTVQIVALEGVATSSTPGTARLELILDLAAPGPLGHRFRLTEEETLSSREPEDLATAMGVVLSRAAVRVGEWVERKLE